MSGEYQKFEDERYGILDREIVRLLRPSTRILDVGCGTGRLMEKLRDLGCSCVGVDISQVAVDIVQQKGFPAFKSKLPNLPQGLDDSSFDVCTMVETLEHLTYPAKTLKNLSKVLKRESGFIIVSVPDDCMKPEEFDEHVSAFSVHSLHEVMSRYYEVDTFFSFAKAGHQYLLMKGKRLSKPLL